MKKYFIIVPLVMVSIALMSCRSSEEMETPNSYDASPSRNIEISNTPESDSVNVASAATSEDEKDPPVKDRQDWKNSN